MTTIKIRNVEEWVADTHKMLAANKGLSMESYLRNLLQDAALEPQHRLASDLLAQFEYEKSQNRLMPPGYSTQLIRDDRDVSV